MAHFMNILRIMTIPGIFVMYSLPSVSCNFGVIFSLPNNYLMFLQGLLISLMTTTVLTILQTLLLRIPALRLALKIPVVAAEHRGKLPRLRDTYQRIRDYFSSDLKKRVDTARKQAMEKERMNRTRRW